MINVETSDNCFFFFSSRRRHTRFDCDWSSDVCSSDLTKIQLKNKPSMKTKIVNTLATLLLPCALNCQLSTGFAQGSAFTYQGVLTDNGHPANGSYDLTFTLFSVPSDGIALAGPLTNSTS